jgi:hypothetical protein
MRSDQFPRVMGAALGIAASLVFGLALIQATAAISEAASAIFGTPVPVSTPASGETPNAIVPSGLPTPSYFVRAPSSLVGKVLHQTMSQYINFPASPDPANGKVVVGELWIQVGPDGVPTRYHGRYTLADGTFHQETIQTPDQVLDAYGLGYGPGGRCERWASSSSKMPGLLPAFVNEQALARSGFVLQGTRLASIVLKAAPAMPEAPPQISYTYLSDTAVQVWEQQRTEDSSDGSPMKRVRVWETGSGGYLMGVTSRLFDTKDNLVREEVRAYGPLNVYDPSIVPAAAWDLSPEAKVMCK